MLITLISCFQSPSDEGIRIISSVLKKEGYSVQLIFMITKGRIYNNKELKELNEKISGSTKLIGVSCMSNDSRNAFQVVNLLKKRNIPMVLGGVHATVYPEGCIKHCGIVCVGEGEETIVELANAIRDNKPIDKIQNLWIKKENKIIKNPVRDIINNIDKLPFPDFNLFNHYILKKNKIVEMQKKHIEKYFKFLSGRGCPYACDYCSNNLFNELYKGKRKSILRWHSVDYIIRFANSLKETYPNEFKVFELWDDSFFLRPIEHFREFNKRFKKEIGVDLYCNCDPRTVTYEKIRLMVEAGLKEIGMGIEADEKTNQNIYHRYMTNEQVIKSAEILNKFSDKITIFYDIITCNPYETPEDILNTINLIRKLPRPFRLNVFGLIFIFGTELYKKALKNKLIKEEDEGVFYGFDNGAKHILLRRKNAYLCLITYLMGEGACIKNKYGLLTDKRLDYLLEPKRVKKNIENPFYAILFTRLYAIRIFVRYKILRPIYIKFPINIRKLYSKIKYRNEIIKREEMI